MARKNLRGRNRHHLIPRSVIKEYGLKELGNNLLLIHVERHTAWHKVFGNLTLDEVIELLTRLRRAKNATKRAK